MNWICWVRLQAPDKETAERWLGRQIGDPKAIVKVQSEASHQIEEEEIAAVLKRAARHQGND